MSNLFAQTPQSKETQITNSTESLTEEDTKILQEFKDAIKQQLDKMGVSIKEFKIISLS
jgi:hypothetical protein